MITFEENLAQLADTFPTLRGAQGLRPFNCPQLLEYARSNGGSGMNHAANFIANLYNNNNEFNLARAFGAWDEQHRMAFAAWAANPFIH